MGLMQQIPECARLVTTPHPVSLDGQTNIAAQLIKGETLQSFLSRSVPGWADDAWEVRINGVVVPYEVMDRLRPKDGTLIEVRGVVHKQALYVVAMIALIYFTAGAGATAGGALGSAAGAGTFYGAAGLTAAALAGVAVVGGTILINKVLGPKPPSTSGRGDQESVFSIGATRNQARQYQPPPLVFGTVKFAPDIISAPTWWYQNNDQYMGIVLTPGIGVASFEPLSIGDAQLSSLQGVQVWQTGFSGMPDQTIPLSTNVDTIAGGELNKDRTWVQRTTSADTVRIEIGVEYTLGDSNSKGKQKFNIETVEVQYSPIGTGAWQPLISRTFANKDPLEARRATLTRVVEQGQYDVRVRILGRAVDGGGSNGVSRFQFGSMASVQADLATYAGLPRVGVQIKATGQLSGTPDEIRGVFHTEAIPVWKGAEWVNEESSNPGAQILKYARGYFDEYGQIIAGMGLADEDIDIESLQGFMLHCAANNFQYNYLIRDVRNHDEMLAALAAAGFGQTSDATGRLSVSWAADAQPLSSVVNMATIKKGQFQVDYTLANAADGIEYSYYDAEDWSTKTIRVPAPGVTTMLNPASLTGEGITSEAHAAQLARWHLAQSLYQYKDISFSTDIEHLSYRRLSLLSLSHDLTQWGRSGRVMGASIAAGVVSLALDEPVRAPASGSAYIGLRIPGERTYRVFGVQPFTGETDTLTLTGAWPNDAALPGEGDGNPAWDTLWCYDFKATPGYRVRVVSIEQESDLKGASVAVVPEGPEFWNYVKTGEYIPAANESLLQTRPVMSGLKIGERQVTQGDTVFTELTASFEIDGPVGDVVIQMADEDGILEEVARTTTRFASWRIPSAGTYTISARGFSPEGLAGNTVTLIYSTIGADAPPVLVDLFDVAERSGGVRLYTWGWLTGTTQSADFAGVEIRYVAGSVPDPVWADMTPVGEDGYHTAPFEAVIPESGQWTFAARSRNTSGTLSTSMRVLTKTLGANLGEQIGGIEQSLDWITQQQVAQQALIDQAALDAAQAQAAAAEALALAGTAWNDTTTWPTGAVVYEAGRMYRALQPSVGVQPPNPAYWQDIGTITEAQGATTQAISQLRTDVDAQGVEFAAAITQVRAGQVGGGNLLPNSTFNGLSRWSVTQNDLGASGKILPSDGSLAGDPNIYTPPGSSSVLIYGEGASPSGSLVQIASDHIAATEFSRLIGSVWVNNFRCTASIRIYFYNSSGALIGWSTIASATNQSARTDATFANIPRLSTFLDLNQNVATFRLALDLVTNGSGSPYCWFVMPMVEYVEPPKSDPSPWVAPAAGLASATFALQVAQDAQITLTTNVNGHVAGMVSKNDGQRGVISFLADVFEIITSGTVGVRFTRRNGGYFMRFYAASIQTILGINFGASNNLCFWYGPNVGEENCTQANGTIWFNNVGSAYFGGSLSAGVLKNAAQSTQISTAATVDTGPFTTNGGARVVNSSMSYTNAGVTATDQGGTVALTAGVVVERSRDNGATWAQISNFTATGQRIFVGFEPGIGYSYQFALTGSTTYTDNTGGTANVNYRLRIVSASGPWPYNFGSGANPLGRQNLSVISVEQ